MRLKSISIFAISFRQLGIHLFAPDRTLIQLRNSSGMRLLRNRQVTDAILDYYRDVDLIASLQEVSLQQERNFRGSSTPLLDGRQWDEVIDPGTDNIITLKVALHLRSTDPVAINNCLLWISDLKGIHNGFRGEVVDLQKKATNLRRIDHAEFFYQIKGNLPDKRWCQRVCCPAWNCSPTISGSKCRADAGHLPKGASLPRSFSFQIGA